jgi:hypothetical protein
MPWMIRLGTGIPVAPLYVFATRQDAEDEIRRLTINRGNRVIHVVFTNGKLVSNFFPTTTAQSGSPFEFANIMDARNFIHQLVAVFVNEQAMTAQLNAMFTKHPPLVFHDAP